MKVVGLIGRMGSGKSTAASYFVENYGFTLVKFAHPLKAMLVSLGLEPEQLEDAELKKMPSEVLCGKTPRDAMQTLGTEWGRDMIGQNLWINAWQRLASHYNFVVVDDVRFPNEAQRVIELGGRLIKIERPGHEPADRDHASERYVDDLPYHALVLNDGPIDRLGQRAYAEAWK